MHVMYAACMKARHGPKDMQTSCKYRHIFWVHKGRAPGRSSLNASTLFGRTGEERQVGQVASFAALHDLCALLARHGAAGCVAACSEACVQQALFIVEHSHAARAGGAVQRLPRPEKLTLQVLLQRALDPLHCLA